MLMVEREAVEAARLLQSRVRAGRREGFGLFVLVVCVWLPRRGFIIVHFGVVLISAQRV